MTHQAAAGVIDPPERDAGLSQASERVAFYRALLPTLHRRETRCER